jgi:hypothetical protein
MYVRYACSMCILMHLQCMHTCICTWACIQVKLSDRSETCVCVYAYVYVCMKVCMYAYVHACMCVLYACVCTICAYIVICARCVCLRIYTYMYNIYAQSLYVFMCTKGSLTESTVYYAHTHIHACIHTYIHMCRNTSGKTSQKS